MLKVPFHTCVLIAQLSLLSGEIFWPHLSKFTAVSKSSKAQMWFSYVRAIQFNTLQSTFSARNSAIIPQYLMFLENALIYKNAACSDKRRLTLYRTVVHFRLASPAKCWAFCQSVFLSFDFSILP